MQTFNIPEAEPHFARLVKIAANGEVIMVAEGGKPVAKVVPVQDLEPAPQSGMDEDEIAAMFYASK